MNINFSPVDEGFIKGMVESGYYSNATELVRDAVRRLREKQSGNREALMAALAEGEASLAADGGIPYTPGFMEDCMERAREMVKNGYRPKPEVMP